MSNADTVRAIYASFGRGDVEGILEHISPDDEWHVWTFDDEGRVLTLRHLIDTKKHHDAWAG